MQSLVGGGESGQPFVSVNGLTSCISFVRNHADNWDALSQLVDHRLRHASDSRARRRFCMKARSVLTKPNIMAQDRTQCLRNLAQKCVVERSKYQNQGNPYDNGAH